MGLGITLRIFSKSNTKELPYTEYNKNKPTIFNIFYDTRSPGHFQSLKQPKIKKSPQNRYSLGDSSENEGDMDEIFNKDYGKKKDLKSKQLRTPDSNKMIKKKK